MMWTRRDNTVHDGHTCWHPIVNGHVDNQIIICQDSPDKGYIINDIKSASTISVSGPFDTFEQAEVMYVLLYGDN